MSCYEFSGIKACSETHCMRVFSSFPSYSNIGILDQLLEMGEAGDEMSEIDVWHGMAWHATSFSVNKIIWSLLRKVLQKRGSFENRR